MAGIILEYFCSVFVFVFYIISSYVTSMNMLQNRHLVNVIDLDFQCSKYIIRDQNVEWKVRISFLISASFVSWPPPISKRYKRLKSMFQIPNDYQYVDQAQNWMYQNGKEILFWRQRENSGGEGTSFDSHPTFN